MQIITPMDELDILIAMGEPMSDVLDLTITDILEVETGAISVNEVDRLGHEGLYNGSYDLASDPYDVIDQLEYIDDWSDATEVQILKDNGWL